MLQSFEITNLLIARFPDFLKAFDQYCPFTRDGQLQNHLRTIQHLRNLGSVKAALNDSDFQRSLYQTLQAWGIGSRASVLRPFSAFVDALQANAEEIRDLEGLTINDPDLDAPRVSKRLARLTQGLDIVDNKTRVVAGSKALHHLLPELVVPIDREYTQTFFGWHNSRFQNFPEDCFIDAFLAFVRIARAVNPVQYVGHRWYTSRTKVIDNAVVGLCCSARYDVKDPAG